MEKDEFFTTEELKVLLLGKKIQLDCGHYATIGYGFSHTIIIVSEGGGNFKTQCHNCGY